MNQSQLCFISCHQLNVSWGSTKHNESLGSITALKNVALHGKNHCMPTEKVWVLWSRFSSPGLQNT